MLIPARPRIMITCTITAIAFAAAAAMPACQATAPPQTYEAAIAVNQSYLRRGAGATCLASFLRERQQWAIEHPGQTDELRATVIAEHNEVLSMNDAAARELASRRPPTEPEPAGADPGPNPR